MRLFIINTFFLLVCLVSAFGQTTATDFTTEDCDGIMHNLYDSLDAGNIIVIAWVMPCGPCATYALPAYSAVQSFNASYPGIVDFYLVDDYANTSCASIVNWGNNNNMPINTTFSSPDINMMDYGSNGMPKVVVLGGSNYVVYYNENDDKINYNAVEMAISDALSVSIINEISDINASVYPNPPNDILNIHLRDVNLGAVYFKVSNTLGEVVLTGDNLHPVFGSYSTALDISSLSRGVYFLNISAKLAEKTIKFLVLD